MRSGCTELFPLLAPHPPVPRLLGNTGGRTGQGGGTHLLLMFPLSTVTLFITPVGQPGTAAVVSRGGWKGGEVPLHMEGKGEGAESVAR